MDNNKRQDDVHSSEENALEQPQSVNALDSLSQGNDDVHLAPDEKGSEKQKKDSKKGGIKRIWGVLNVYLLIFLLLVVIAGIVFVVSYLNSQKQPQLPSAALQNLSQDELKDIANGDAKVGDPRYTLNIQSDAVFAGSALIRGDLNVAGSVQLGQQLTIPSLNVSGATNLNTVQISTLHVAAETVLQGRTTINDSLTVQGKLNAENDVNISKALTVGGTITTPQLVTGSLVLAGSGSFNLNNHISANGPRVSRTQGPGVGTGGTTSINGSDVAGTLIVNTGNTPPPGCFATINFVQKFAGTPKIIITPVGADAGQVQYYVTRTVNNFSICSSGNTPAGKQFAFDYLVIG
jgi:hypothetical protein